MSFIVEHAKQAVSDKQTNVVIFSATAIALYGYDQGMMSLINTNNDYLSTMGLEEESPVVGVIVAVYYLGCAVGAVLFSMLADKLGRKKSIFASLATASLGNLIMFVAGMGMLGKSSQIALGVMLAGRVVMGLGVGGIDAVIPTYSSELSADDSRGKALAQEFQSNIFGLVMAFGINLLVTILLGKQNQWAWRIPIIVMQIYPVLLMAVVERLPESPRWFIFHDRQEDAKNALNDIYGDEGKEKLDELLEQHEKEKDVKVGYLDMLTPGHEQFHPTMVTVMCQVNQALTGYGAVSVYGPQIFELLGFSVRNSEYLTLGNYTSYFFLMTLAWLLIDALGRRQLMIQGSIVLSSSFALLAVFGGLAAESDSINIPVIIPGIIGTVILFVATGAFGIGWLSTVWLFPTEVFPTTARAQGTAISVIVWGLANFAITFLTPVLFNNLDYFIFLVFAATNAFAGLWTYFYLPETGGRTFDENMDFFKEAGETGTWRVGKVRKGEWKKMLYDDPEGEGAPSDSPQDSDIYQSSYLGGEHNIDPSDLSQFTQLWNASFNVDEKHWARPLVHTLSSTGRQIVFTASTKNRIRTFDAETGQLLNERQVAPPWPMDQAFCTTHVSKTLGIMGTPVIYREEGNEIAFFYVKSYIEDYREPGGAYPPLNSVYYLYGVYLDTLQNLYKYPMIIDGQPSDNDIRKTFLGGLVLQRPALLLLGDVLYAGFGGLCDAFNYTGSVVAVNLATQSTYTWTTQAGNASLYSDDWTAWHGGGAGGIWQAGMGLSSDGQDVFFTIDNGGGSTAATLDVIPKEGHKPLPVLSETVARITLDEVSGAGIQLVDFFRPSDWQTDSGQDIGSGGLAILDADVFKTMDGKRIGVATSTNPKMYVTKVDNLGGYLQGKDGTDGILQTIALEGEVFGAIGSYPLEGGYIYVNPGNTALSAYAFTQNASSLFSFAGKSSETNGHWGGAGLPTITSNNGQPGTGIVWATDVQAGLMAFKAVPVNGTLVELPLPKVEGAVKFGRPVFGNGKVFVVDGQGRLIALGKRPQR
ncbi:hypothetical protein ACET3X_009279 [Alternaria dauci]|uniref:Major facilitator superfamily (MFS) profile domain-containing protein n=1 Tax=Alternaria dauci TaxID=48095 RepID=A0ABR3U8B8_9PLEO